MRIREKKRNNSDGSKNKNKNESLNDEFSIVVKIHM
jgi:hypothetical protein